MGNRLNRLAMVVRTIWLFVLVCLCAAAHGQKQLILLKRERVLLRLYPGDDFIYREKGSRSVKVTYVNNISDTAIVTHRDTVPFRKIDRVYFRQHKFYNTVGTALTIFGTGLFLIDQANFVLVQGNTPALDDGVSAVSVTTAGVGIPLMLMRKKSQKLDYRVRLMMVDRASVFYRPDTRESILPYEE